MVYLLLFHTLEEDRFCHLSLHERLGGPRHPLLNWKSVYSCSLAMHWEQELLWPCVISTIGGLSITFFLQNIFNMNSSQRFMCQCAPFVPFICLSRSTNFSPGSCTTATPKERNYLKALYDPHSQHWQFSRIQNSAELLSSSISSQVDSPRN